jgi:NitT/TauT family transport system permease protein
MNVLVRNRIVIWQVAVLAGTVGAWEGLAARGVLDPFFFSRPSHVAVRIAGWFASGSIYRHIAVTTQETLLAFLVGTILGVVFGFVFARSAAVSTVFEPYIKVANAMPRIVLAPIFTLWFGLGILSRLYRLSCG